MLEPGAARKSRTRAGAYGRQTSAPIVQHTHVTCSAGKPSQHGFLGDDAGGVPERSHQTQQDPGQRRGPGRRRETDHHHPGERHRAADDERPREWLSQEHDREGDQEDRSDVDEHRRRSRVDAPLRFVEDDAVQAKPQEAGDQQESYVAPRGPSPSTGQEQGA